MAQGVTPLGLVLAGGQSTRMGGTNKALIELDGKTLVARAVERLGAQTKSIAINANVDLGDAAPDGVPILTDPIDGFLGPLAGILAGLDWAAVQGASHVVSVAVDTPFFPKDFVQRLSGAATDSLPIAMASDPDGQYRHPTFALWPVALADILRAELTAGTRKVIAFADPQGCARVPFPAPSYDPFFNINTPQDLDTARTMVEHSPSL